MNFQTAFSFLRTMKYINYYILSFLLIVSLSVKAQLVGHWDFNDPNNLSKAVIGKDLILVGKVKAVAGPDKKNGAVRIGSGNYFRAIHNIHPKKGDERVNEYSIIFDVKISALNKMYALFQTDLKNSDNAECFINKTGEFGSEGTWYSPTALKANEWYRLGISVKNREIYIYYLDGVKVFDGYYQRVDMRFSLDPNGLLLFADENGEDNEIFVSDVNSTLRS